MRRKLTAGQIQFVSDEGYPRMIGAQPKVTEARHRLARKIFFGQRGELRQHYREGMEDQLGAPGLALNSVVLFNSLYIDAAVKQLAADGFPVTDDLLARLSPLQYDHINFLSRYAFTRPAAPGLRQLRDPHTDDEDDDGGQE
jgi:hypothetical protein